MEASAAPDFDDDGVDADSDAADAEDGANSDEENADPDLEALLAAAPNGPWKCRFCCRNKNSTWKSFLRHLRNCLQNPKRRVFGECVHCGRTFSEPSILKQHLTRDQPCVRP